MAVKGEGRLNVNGEIWTRKVKVTQSGWADFVFEPGYHLPSLQEVERYVAVNRHLPDVPSAEEVEKDGLDLGEMNKQLLQKVEELTLYLLQQEKKMKEMEGEIQELKKNIKK